MALITCPECGKSISDKATACPGCGAPSADTASSSPVASAHRVGAPEEAGTVCPFSGHVVPAQAFVCECGAYYGYKGGVLTDQKFVLLLKLVGAFLALLALGYVFEWQLAAILGAAGTIIFGVVLIAFVLPIRLQGKKWWRAM